MSDPATQKRGVLRRVSLFADLTDAECDAVLAVLKARRGGADEVLFREGDRGDTLMIVLDGTLVARAKTATGEEAVLSTIGPGEMVGELAFVDAERRSATVSSPNRATVLEFTRDSLALLRREQPRIAAAIQRNLLADVGRRLRALDEKQFGVVARQHVPDEASNPAAARKSGRAITVAQLRTVPALARHATEDLELLSHIAMFQPFEARSVLMAEGTAGDRCWLVLTGSVDVTRTSHTTPIATLGAGALIGQLALLDRAPRTATVTASTHTDTLEIHAGAFSNLVKAHSPIALRFQAQVALAAVRQLRMANAQFAQSFEREESGGGGSPDFDGDSLELDLPPPKP